MSSPKYDDLVKAAQEAFKNGNHELSARMWQEAAAIAPPALARIFHDNARALKVA